MTDRQQRNTLFLALFVGAALVTIAVVAIYLLFALDVRGTRIPIGGAVAVVDVVGEINYDRSKLEEIDAYRDDNSIKAVVIYINSPGGGVAASQSLYHAVERLSWEKPVVACMASVAASGGYYVACGADSIVAHEGTITGSIGVIAAFLRTEELYQKIGLGVTIVKSGRWKDVGSPHREMTPEERAYMADILDSAYEQFVRAVSEGRGLDLEEVRGLAEGRLYTGEQALAVGLVDTLGSYEDAIEMAARMGGIEGDPRVVRRHPRRSLFERIFGRGLVPWEANREERVALRYIIP